MIKDVEAELGISYPTVRARLDDVLRSMDFPASGEEPTPRQVQAQAREERRRVLDALREGSIGAEEAATRLVGL